LGLVLLAALSAWLLFPEDEVRSRFHDDVMAVATVERSKGKFRINITQIVDERLRQNADRSETDVFKELGLEEVKVVRANSSLLKEYSADIYKVFEAIIHRTGPVSYWSVTVFAFYKDGTFVDTLAYVNFESL
jgi:hypothetical protein